MRRRAIVLSAHPWRGPFRLGAHQIARALANADFDVLYLSAPLSPPHLAGLPFSDRLRLRWSEYISPPTPADVRVLAPFTLTPLSAHWGANKTHNLLHWPSHTIPSLRWQLQRLGFMKPDIALMDGPLQFAAASLASPRKLVLRIFDRFACMPGMTEALLDLAKVAAKQADLVVYSAQSLKSDAEEMGANRLFYLPNGVDAAHFAQPRPEPSLYRDIPKPRAVYVGQTGSLFDAALIAATAKENPQVSFIIIGPENRRLSELQAMANVHLIGPIDWTELPGYLQHTQIGLVPFDVENFRDYASSINPLKIYEYFAAGIPALATSWTELELLGAPSLYLAEKTSFGRSLREALHTPISAAVLRQYAVQESWDAKIKRLVDVLS